MVKGWPQLSPRGVITAVNAVRRISSEAGRTSRVEVTRKLGRTVSLFCKPRNRRGQGTYPLYLRIDYSRLARNRRDRATRKNRNAPR